MAERVPWWMWPARVAVVVGALAGVGWLSNQPFGEDPQTALVRLAWRTAGQQVRLCRQRSAEELSRLTQHMRQAQDCRARTLPYRLEVRINGQVRVAHPVQSIGAWGDRPLYVQEELQLDPGTYRLEIDFRVAPELTQGPGGIATDNEAQQQALAEALAAAVHYRQSAQVHVRAGRIVLVELNESGGDFRIHGG